MNCVYNHVAIMLQCAVYCAKKVSKLPPHDIRKLSLLAAFGNIVFCPNEP